MKSKPFVTGKNKLFLGVVSLFGFSGVYFLTSGTDLFKSISHAVDTTILSAIRNQVINPIDESIKEFRVKTKYALDGMNSFIGDVVYTDQKTTDTVENESLLTTIYEGGKEILVVIKNLIKELITFLVEKFVPYVQDHSVEDSFELLKSYIEPINHAFSRPNTERLQSAKNRLQQYLGAFKTPEFWKSLPIMHQFYMEFKDQIATLTEEQLSEVIDIYLDDPVEMYKKVALVMEATKGDQDIKSKFSSDLMMDFVRGENIDVMKARLTAAKVSSGLNSVFDLLGLTKKNDSDQNDQGKIDPRAVEDKITEVFERVASLFA